MFRDFNFPENLFKIAYLLFISSHCKNYNSHCYKISCVTIIELFFPVILEKYYVEDRQGYPMTYLC